ncbi:sugar ABC transporter ATP-binding protein [Mesorhizobium xinjiangense]|uniref:sugar ABC transporter ATP-binding protein n=1 Tax=Mesorhizobium xinjiangense TaxID=2678685 RepID=UPI0012ECC008|nr:sugar ABC transporter ATP-binding protein [Mesorhizobium xinjiangense]
MSKLKLSGVAKSYGATVALSRGDLELEAGEVHVLIGSNGSGKSTLCKIVAGSVKPDSGEVLLDGNPVTVTGPQAAKALGIGIFYQELSLAGHRTVEENICLPDLPMRGPFIDRKALSQRAARYIALFDGVTGQGFSADATVDSLRADQRQLVEIMKALATEAPILIFDEPTSALDRSQVERFFEILRRLKENGRAMVFISHRMDEIFAIGDRVTVIRDGATVGTSRISEAKPAEVIHLMVGEQEDLVERQAPASAAQPSAGDAALTGKHLTGPGFADVSFQVAKGEILGFGGLHGQGQSAVLRAIFGASTVDSGEVLLGGERFTPKNPRQAITHGIAYVSGDRGRDGIIQGRPILENLTPVHFLRERLFLARPSALRAKAQPAMGSLRTKFGGFALPIGSLSGGNQQKVVIARWLIDRPDVLLLDDPTKGIDLSAKADLFSLIRELAAQGLGIVLYSSEDAELLVNADRILVFNGGRITRELTGTDRTRYNLYEAAYEAAA